jgi:Ca2+-binding EF-hand superfamily protein
MSLRFSLPAVILLSLGTYSGAARAQAPGGVNFQELFQTLDANDDKAVTRDEVPESGKSAFDGLVKLADSDGDGRIDQREFFEALQLARESALSALPRNPAEFEAVDKNKDGKISRDEFQGVPFMFARADADGDGTLSPAEAVKFRETAGTNAQPGANQFGPRFVAMDRNKDGKIARDEFTGVPENFDRIDSNKDGSLSPPEIRQFFLNNNPTAPPATPKPAEAAGAPKVKAEMAKEMAPNP